MADPAPQTAGRDVTDTVRAVLLAVRSLLRRDAGAAREALPALREAARIARIAGDSPLETAVLSCAAQVLAASPESDGTPPAGDGRPRPSARERPGDGDSHLTTLYRLVTGRCVCGRPERVAETRPECLEHHIADHFEDREPWLVLTEVLIRLTETYTGTGEPRGAVRCVERRLALSGESGHERPEAAAHRVLGDAPPAPRDGARAVTRGEAGRTVRAGLGDAVEESGPRRRIEAEAALARVRPPVRDEIPRTPLPRGRGSSAEGGTAAADRRRPRSHR